MASLTVKTNLGAINGVQCPSLPVNSYLGIPFVKPPTGDLRYASPAPYNSPYPGGTLNATNFGATCVQFISPDPEPLWPPPNEDCLYLNVWTPSKATPGAKLPVKIWIYGGSWTGGGTSDPLYSGCNLANDAIVVSIAYRLGPLGWLSLTDAGLTGNQGLQDLILGIQWVQDNIAAFGGDPKKVLVFGESAGAGLSWILSTLPNAPRVMNAAISESGAGAVLPTTSNYQPWGQTFAQNLGCAASDVNCLRSKSVQDLVKANPPASASGGFSGSNRWMPIVDGKFVTQQPLLTPARVPFLAGTNGDDGALFTQLQYYSPTNVTADDYTTVIESVSGGFQSTAAKVLQAYPLSEYGGDSIAPFHALSQLYTDKYFKCPTRQALNVTLKANIDAFTYYNNHTPTCVPNYLETAETRPILGAMHASEIFLIFGHLTDLPAPNGTCNASEAEKGMSLILTDAWTSLAGTGRPGIVDPKTGTPWPKFSIDRSDGVILSDDNNLFVGSINYTICDTLWDEINYSALLNATTGSANPTNSSSSPTAATSTGASSSAAAFTGAAESLSPSATTLLPLLFAMVCTFSTLSI